MNSKLKRYSPFLITYFIIFVALFVQHNVVHMYFDDYGNASLSYATVVKDVIKTNYTFKQLLDEAVFTYFNFGGRILYGMIVTLLLKHGIKPFMFTQIFVILGIFYNISSIISKITKKNSVVFPILCMILYMLFDITILRHSIYWASASVLYLWPLLPFFILINYYMKTSDLIKKGESVNYLKYILLNIILIIFTAFSQEQIGVGLITFLIIYILFDHIKEEKKYLKYDLFTLLFSVITYLALFMAPGNWSRLETSKDFSNLSFFEKIDVNMPKIFDLLFKVKGSIYINILIAIVLMYVIFIFVKKYKKNKLYFLLLIPIFGMILSFIIYDKQYYNYPKRLEAIGCIILISLLISLFIYYKNNKQLKYIALPIGAGATVFCLLMSPYMLERCIIPCMFILFITIISIGYELYKSNKTMSVLLLIMISVSLYYGTSNYIEVYLGYKGNDKTNSDNYYKLEHYKKYRKGNEIKLCKVKNSFYGSTQPYESNFNLWISEYFDLPEKLEMKWIDCNE